MTLSRKIPLGKNERRMIRIRVEAYNVFNHTEFSTIGTTMQMKAGVQTNTTWGQYTGTYAARQMSTTLRIEF